MGGGADGAPCWFLGLRGLRALQPEPVADPMRAGTVVVVGVTDRSSLTGSDRVLIDSHSGDSPVRGGVGRLFAVDRGAVPGQWVHAARRAALVSRIRAR